MIELSRDAFRIRSITFFILFLIIICTCLKGKIMGGQCSVLSNQEWAKLEKGAHKRHATIWAIMRFTSARIGEVIQLRVENCYSDDGRVLEAIYFPKMIRKGKTESLSRPVNSSLRRYLEAYDHPQHGWLFPSPRNSNHAISYEACLKYLQSQQEKVGLTHLKIGTHCGRRTCLTNMANNGVNTSIIQKVSGHRSLQNLQRYIDVSPMAVKNALELVA